MSKATDLKKKLLYDDKNIKSDQPVEVVNKKKNFGKRFWFRFTIVVAIIGLAPSIYFYTDWFKSPSDEVKALHEVSGEVKSQPITTYNNTPESPGQLIISRPPILRSEAPPSLIGILLPKNLLIPKPPIEINFANVMNTHLDNDLGRFYTTGFTYTIGTLGYHIEDVSISFKIIANRLFLSTSFRDIETNNLVGVIKYNKWTLYIPNMIGFQQTDTSLEVTDLHGYKIIRVKFKGPQSVLVQGYFADLDSAMVVGNHLQCFNINTDRIPMYEMIRNIDSLPW